MLQKEKKDIFSICESSKQNLWLHYKVGKFDLTINSATV